MPVNSNLFTLDRRVVLKASALLATWIAAGGLPAYRALQGALAQTTPATQSWQWQQNIERGDIPVEQAGDYFTITTPFPFTAVSAHWSGQIGTWPVVEARFSDDGTTFSNTSYLTANADNGRPAIDNRIQTGLLAAIGASQLQYRVLDRSGIPVAAEGFSLTFLDTSDGPAASDLTAASGSGSAPAILLRADWGANEGLSLGSDGEIWPPAYETVSHILVHHTETSNVEDAAQVVRAIYFDHAVTRGWGDIGYNYLVDRSGNIYEGRAGGANVIGGHAYQYQNGSSGVALVGDFGFDDLTEDARAALVALIAWLAEDLDPAATTDFGEKSNVPVICGHRDLEETACPGDLLYDDLTSLRALVNETVRARRFSTTFSAGERVITISSVNQRDSPAADGKIIGTLLTGESATVIGGPENAGDIAWYEIESSLGDGWVAGHYLASAGVDGEAAPLEIGDLVVVATDRLNVRSEPDPESEIITTLSTSEIGLILDGPVEAGGYTWWLIETGGGTGWAVAEFLERSSVA